MTGGRWRLIAGIAVATAAGFAAYVWSQAERSLDLASAQWAAGDSVSFTTRTIGPTASPFELLPGVPSLRDAAFFAGDLWLVGDRGLRRINPTNGQVLHSWRVGRDLPAAPIVALAVHRPPGASEPVLLAATAGRGLLVVSNSGDIIQWLPDDRDLADLTALLPLRSGTVLVGTERRGVLSWDGRNLRRAHQRLDDLEVTALAGEEGDVWIGTLQDGLKRWSNGSLQEYGEADGLPDRRVLSLAYADRALYAGTPLGVSEFQDGRYERSLADGFFAGALHVGTESLFVGTLDEGILDVRLTGRTRPGDGTAVDLKDVRALLNAPGGVAAVNATSALSRPDHERGWHPLWEDANSGLRDGNVSALHVDAAGRLWVGYFDRGLDVMDSDHERIVELENDQIFCVNRIKPAASRAIAVATTNGLAYFDAAARMRSFLTSDDGLISQHVTDFIASANQEVIATPAGLTFLGPSGPQSLYAFHGLVNNHVYSLAAQGDRLAAGTLGGLSELEAGQVVSNHTTANSPLSHNWVSAVVSFGDEWFAGLYGGGVARLSPAGEWTTYPDLAGIEINPNAMVATPSAVYAGSLDRGLLVYQAGEDRWRFASEGLPSENVTALAADGDLLYVGTNNGLAYAQEADLLAR